MVTGHQTTLPRLASSGVIGISFADERENSRFGWGAAARSRTATGTTPFATCFTRFGRIELMGLAAGVRRFAAQAGDFFLPLGIYRCEAALRRRFLNWVF
jgi:hypothetical protein